MTPTQVRGLALSGRVQETSMARGGNASIPFWWVAFALQHCVRVAPDMRAGRPASQRPAGALRCLCRHKAADYLNVDARLREGGDGRPVLLVVAWEVARAPAPHVATTPPWSF